MLGHDLIQRFRPNRAGFFRTCENECPDAVRNITSDGFHPIDECFPKDKRLRFGGSSAVGNRSGHKPEVQWNRPGAGFQDTEIDWQPPYAVHHQMNYPIAFLDASGDQCLRDSVGLIIESSPGSYPPNRLCCLKMKKTYYR